MGCDAGDDLATRRRAVAERLLAKQHAETRDRLRQDEAAGDTARRIAASVKAHPSNPKPYDREAET